MGIRRRDTEIAERCRDMELILWGINRDALVEGVAKFQYLGRPLDKTKNDWPAVRWNVNQARRVWGRLGKMLRKEGAETRVVEVFYQAAAQAVLLFLSDAWFLLAAM